MILIELTDEERASISFMLASYSKIKADRYNAIREGDQDKLDVETSNIRITCHLLVEYLEDVYMRQVHGLNGKNKPQNIDNT